jgi:hypothetical protein
MARKANSIGPNIHAMIKDARIDLAQAARPVCKCVCPVSNCPSGHRNFKFWT